MGVGGGGGGGGGGGSGLGEVQKHSWKGKISRISVDKNSCIPHRPRSLYNPPQFQNGVKNV